MTHCPDPECRTMDLINAVDLRFTTMIEAVEAKGVLRDEKIQARLDGLDRAIAVAHDAMNLRLQGMNEIRASMSDQAATFASRDALTALADKIEDLRVASGRTGGLQTGNEAVVKLAVQGVMLVAAAILGAVISHMVK